MAQTLKTDWILFTTVMLLVLFGAVMVYSASSVVADIRMGSSYYFAIRQLMWVALGVPLMMWLKKLNYRKLQTPVVAFTAMGLVVMLLVVVYFADPRQHRWIRFPALEACSLQSLPSPPLRCFLRTLSHCGDALSTHVRRYCPQCSRSG